MEKKGIGHRERRAEPEYLKKAKPPYPGNPGADWKAQRMRIGELFQGAGNRPGAAPAISPGLANLLMKYLSVQREKSRKYSQSWQRQHTAGRRRTENRCKGGQLSFRAWAFPPLTSWTLPFSSVSDQADAIREGMKTAEKRMKELQKLIEYGKNYTEYKPIHDELKKAEKWLGRASATSTRKAHRAELYAYGTQRAAISMQICRERDKDLAYL